MSENPFKDFINGLDIEDETPTPNRFGLRDVKVTTWDGEEIDVWGDDSGLGVQCPECGFVHPFIQRFCDECGADMTGGVVYNDDDSEAETPEDSEAEWARKQSFAQMWNFVLSAMANPVWARVCTNCVTLFLSKNWQAQLCEECEEDEGE